MELAPLNSVIDQHRSALLGRLVGMADRSSDEAARSVAEYCYEFLPWPIRMAVKKPAFVEFVVAQRVSVLARLHGGS